MNPHTRRALIRFSSQIIISAVAIYLVTRSPQFGYFRSIDMVLLFAAGTAFGAGIVELIVNLRNRS